MKVFLVTLYAGHCSASITKWRDCALCGTSATVTLTFELMQDNLCLLGGGGRRTREISLIWRRHHSGEGLQVFTYNILGTHGH